MSEPRRGLAPALAVAVGAASSLLPSWAHAPLPLYDPIGRAWRVATLGTPGPVIEMSYYGIYLYALVGALIGALLGRLLERRALVSQPVSDAWAFTALGLAAAYQAWSVWP